MLMKDEISLETRSDLGKANTLSQKKTRRSVEHCTLHADGARLHFTCLSYRFWNDKVEYGRGSISIQSPGTVVWCWRPLPDCSREKGLHLTSCVSYT